METVTICIMRLTSECKYWINKDTIYKVDIVKRNKILSFKNEEDQLRSLFSEILLKHILLSRYMIEGPSEVRYNEWGKPFFKNVDLFYNISHSGEYIVCAVSGHEVGIDIEKCREIDLTLAKRFFAKEEYESLLKVDSTGRIDAFYRLWTLKESYVKYKGIGLSCPLSSFIIDLQNMKIKKPLKDNKLKFKDLEMIEGYSISICTPLDNCRFIVEIVTLEELEKNLLEN